MTLRVIERRLRRDNNLPSDFHFYAWESEPVGHREVLFTRLKGAICPTMKRGKRKGLPNYAKGTNAQEFIVSKNDELMYLEDYESETGNCYECEGSGKTLASANFVTGETTHRTCRRCEGSGRKQED